MPFVLDASVGVSWAFKDDANPVAQKAFALAGADEILVPVLWWFEIRNALIVNEWRRRMDEEKTAIFLQHLNKFSIIVDSLPDEAKVLSFARKHKLTFYDAAYLELAHREDIPLATIDSDMITAARAEKIPLIGK